jgi:hypothetical protein
MNLWGVQGCLDNFVTIVGWLRKSAEETGWIQKVKAMGLAMTTGLAFKIDWDDPAPGLVIEAIRQAEEQSP